MKLLSRDLYNKDPEAALAEADAAGEAIEIAFPPYVDPLANDRLVRWIAVATKVTIGEKVWKDRFGRPDEDIVIFTVTSREHGYNNTTLTGTYTGPATVADVMAYAYHDYFGGRGAWCKDGHWGAICHND